MPVVSPELRVGAFERRVSVGLGLLDTARKCALAPALPFKCHPAIDDVAQQRMMIVCVGEVQSYPFLCAFFDWLC